MTITHKIYGYAMQTASVEVCDELVAYVNKYLEQDRADWDADPGTQEITEQDICDALEDHLSYRGNAKLLTVCNHIMGIPTNIGEYVQYAVRAYVQDYSCYEYEWFDPSGEEWHIVH